MRTDFKYKDIGQHGHSYKQEVSDTNFAPKLKLPKTKPANRFHKKRTIKSTTLVRP